MAAVCNPYQNAFAESFMKTLKIEEVNLNDYQTLEKAVLTLSTSSTMSIMGNGCIPTWHIDHQTNLSRCITKVCFPEMSSGVAFGNQSREKRASM